MCEPSRSSFVSSGNLNTYQILLYNIAILGKKKRKDFFVPFPSFLFYFSTGNCKSGREKNTSLRIETWHDPLLVPSRTLRPAGYSYFPFSLFSFFDGWTSHAQHVARSPSTTNPPNDRLRFSSLIHFSTFCLLVSVSMRFKTFFLLFENFDFPAKKIKIKILKDLVVRSRWSIEFIS